MIASVFQRLGKWRVNLLTRYELSTLLHQNFAIPLVKNNENAHIHKNPSTVRRLGEKIN